MPTVPEPATVHATAQDFISYLKASPTAAFAVRESQDRLEKAGFGRVYEGDVWDLKPGQKFYCIRHHTAIVAGICGMEHPKDAGFRIIGAHTDSPGFRVKPLGLYKKGKALMARLEVYGGPLLYSWLDRDLGLAGRVLTADASGKVSAHWFRIDEPVARIPSVAIHLNRGVNDKGLVVNAQSQMPAMLGMGLTKESVLARIAEAAGVAAEAIKQFDIEPFDLQTPTLGGFDRDMIFGQRLDNLSMCHAGLAALMESPAETAATRLVSLFDSEEVGSSTSNGASSPFMKSTIMRLVIGDGNHHVNYRRSLDRTVVVSADMAHAVHPNYEEMHDPDHKPTINDGPVIKHHASQKYATTRETAAYFQVCAEKADVPVQEVSGRSDIPSGSTIGPIAAAQLGVRTVDVGNPMLSMHAIREQAGAVDQVYAIRVFTQHFNDMPAPTI